MNEPIANLPLLPVVIVALLLAVLSLVTLWLSIRIAGRCAALQSRLDLLLGNDERLERGVREEMAANRREIGETLRANREELTGSVQSLIQTVQQSAEQLRGLVDAKLTQVQADARAGRQEMATTLAQHGSSQKEQTEALGGLLKNQIETFTNQLAQQLTGFGKTSEAALATLRQTLEDRLAQTQRDTRDGRFEQAESLKRFGELLTGQLGALVKSNNEGLEALRLAVEAKLAAIQADNQAKLEQMRQTVDEKLHNTLEQRLGESFKLVSERLEQVHKGLGEMQTLAAGVGDLKKVLSNVKVRGTWGEVQLDALLDQILSPEQYARNVATRPKSAERVEFAIKLPGRDERGTVVWLPIDAKFPLEDYQKLLDAQEAGDPALTDEYGRALELRIKAEAKSIRDKYLEPPHTTDFGLLFLPIEGLYAEVIRRPGLFDLLQRDYRVTVTGPTTLTAILNSLQMGFRSLAIEKRSSEVWQVLGAVKTEFGKFGDVLAKTKKKLDEARSTIDQAEVRTRAIDRRLRNVEALPVVESQGLLDGVVGANEGDEEV